MKPIFLNAEETSKLNKYFDRLYGIPNEFNPLGILGENNKKYNTEELNEFINLSIKQANEYYYENQSYEALRYLTDEIMEYKKILEVKNNQIENLKEKLNIINNLRKK